MKEPFFDIFINGGIGTKLLRLMAGYGEAIHRNIEPNDIRIIDYFYPEGEINHSGNSLAFHNIESIFNYVSISSFTYMKTNKQIRVKRYSFDKEMAKFILYFLGSSRRSEYCQLIAKDNQLEERISNENKKLVFWIRAKDRPGNVKKFDSLAQQMSHRDSLIVLSNDFSLLQGYPVLAEAYGSKTPFEDFQTILRADQIVTQMSGFTLAPFLMNGEKQSLILLNKHDHDKDEYIYLNKDWDFYQYLASGLMAIGNQKMIKVLR